jgi:putative ubiquitin-RnfH superfamily antitoxin RatB of RatAB toxin-antitoxin module
MAESGAIGVTVVLAGADRQRVVNLVVAAGSTAREAVERSGLLEARDDHDGAGLALAIYGRQVGHDHPLEAGDRVEILRPLVQDPKVRRRRLAGSAAATRRGPAR